MREKTMAEDKIIAPKKRRSMLFIFIVLLFFVFYRFSLLNYFGVVIFSDAKDIIKDFERNYLYKEILLDKDYIETRDSIKRRLFTSKSSIEALINHSKQLSQDDITNFSYADIMQGKIGYSLYKKLEIETKKIDNNTYYLRLSSFGENAEKKFSKAIEKMKDIEYLILDLRGNQMGYYAEAIEIADDLLPAGLEIASIECSTSRHYYDSNVIFYEFKKIFVLLDEESACCSEMLALTLKENLKDKVELVGKKTKGMDTGQVYKTYYNKINFSIAAYSWSVKNQASEDLAKHLRPYENMDLGKLEDYMKVVEYLKQR